MKEIDHGTNKVAEEHKIQEMKKIAQMLREKAKKMEESEHAAHISPKDLKQLATDAAKLEKAAEKLKLAFDKKFNKKEKPAAAPKAEKVEALQEGTFDLRKFLVENKLTAGSRMLNEEVADEDIQIGTEYTAMLATDSKGGRTPVKVKVLGRDRSDETKVVVTPLQDVDYKNAESGQMNRFTKGSHYGSEAKYLSK
jgi:hypothetical protein